MIDTDLKDMPRYPSDSTLGPGFVQFFDIAHPSYLPATTATPSISMNALNLAYRLSAASYFTAMI
jgi:hypothetical protein